MHPVICQIGPLTIHSYGVMLAVSALVCSFLLSRDARTLGIKSGTVFDFVFWCVFAGILGARLFYILLNVPYFFEHPLEVIMIHEGGLAWQGGLLGGTLAGIWFVRKHKIPLIPFMDLVAPYIALGESIGRIGCLLNGCCYGREAVWGWYFPIYDAHLHPTQMYMAVSLFVIFLILKWTQKRKSYSGQVFVLYLMLAALERFVVEFFRADHEATWFGLSVFQGVCLVIGVTGFILHQRFKKS